MSVLPEYPINEDIQSLALLNRSLTNQFTNYNTDTLEKILISKKMLLDTVFQDSIASDTLIKVAARALFESGRFDVVVPKELNIVRLDNNELSKPLNINFINELCTDFNVDAILILENFTEQINTKYFLIPGYVTNYDSYDASIDIGYKSEWRLYRPDKTKSALRFQVNDSIFWKANSLSLDDLYSQMPKTKEALIGGGIASGLKMAGFISPGWVNQTRYYFMTGNKEIDAAVPLIKNNQWEEAGAIWAKYTSVKSTTVRGKVEFNLALASEMSGDLNLAIEWGLKSFKTRYTKAIEVYLKTLDNKRKALQNETTKRY